MCEIKSITFEHIYFILFLTIYSSVDNNNIKISIWLLHCIGTLQWLNIFTHNALIKLRDSISLN